MKYMVISNHGIVFRWPDTRRDQRRWTILMKFSRILLNFMGTVLLETMKRLLRGWPTIRIILLLLLDINVVGIQRRTYAETLGCLIQKVIEKRYRSEE